MKFPVLSSYNTRKISSVLIESVRKRRGRVIEKLKENGILDPNYYYNNEDSSEYEESDNETEVNARVCEHCFVFYVNVLKFFEVDGFGNLVEKKAPSARAKTL